MDHIRETEFSPQFHQPFHFVSTAGDRAMHGHTALPRQTDRSHENIEAPFRGQPSDLRNRTTTDHHVVTALEQTGHEVHNVLFRPRPIRHSARDFENPHANPPFSELLCSVHGPGHQSVRIWTPAKYQARPVSSAPACPLFPRPKCVSTVGSTQKL